MKKVLVTRPTSQAGPLTEALETEGYTPVAFPVLEIEHFLPENIEAHVALAALADQCQQLSHTDAFIFISTNAVNTAFAWFDACDVPFQKATLFAIGHATAAALQMQGALGEVIQNSQAMNSESLLALPELQAVSGKSICVVRGVGGRETLKQVLESRGAVVTYFEVYQRQKVDHLPHVLPKLLDEGVNLLTISSGESLDNLVEQAIIANCNKQLIKLPIVVPSERILKQAKERGFRQAVCAPNAGVKAMLDAIKTITV